MVGYENVWCANNQSPNYWGGGACTVQGIIFVYFILASVLWCFIISVNFFLMIVVGIEVKPLRWTNWFRSIFKFENRKSLLSRETLFVFYHLCCWFPPIVVLIISLSAQKIGFGNTDLWCSIITSEAVAFYKGSDRITQHTGGDPVNSWKLALIIVPILLTVIVGCILLIVVVIVGIVKTGWKFCLQHWRLFLFMSFYVWIYIFVLCFEINIDVVSSSQYDAYDTNINCLYVSDVLQKEKGCVLDQKVSFPLWFIVCFNEAGQGFLLFFILGISKRILMVWYELFVNIKNFIVGSNSDVNSIVGTQMTILSLVKSQSKSDRVASKQDESEDESDTNYYTVDGEETDKPSPENIGEVEQSSMENIEEKEQE